MKNFTIYTDGSHLKHTSGRLGIGGILVDENGKKVAEFSQEISTAYLNMSYGTMDVSNPTCEMLAALWALYEFKKYIGPQDTVTLKADYMGVSSWNNGTWKIKMPYIQRIKNDIDDEINKQSLQGRINFAWVKGHQSKSSLDPDARWNDEVDKLAKGEK